jgi:hypothetical protein
MAKQQDLSLNPSKLSGLYGRLKCCLRYSCRIRRASCTAAAATKAAATIHRGALGRVRSCGSGGCGSCRDTRTRLKPGQHETAKPRKPRKRKSFGFRVSCSCVC